MPKIQCPNCATAILAADAPTMRQYAAKIRAADGKVAICSNHRVMGDDSDSSDPNAFYAGSGDPGMAGGAAPSTPAPAPTPAPVPSGGGVTFGSVIGDVGQAASALGQVAQAGVGVYNAVTGKNQPKPPVRPPVAPPKPPVVVLSFTQRHRDLVYGSGGILVAILLVAVIWKFAGKHEKKHEK